MEHEKEALQFHAGAIVAVTRLNSFLINYLMDQKLLTREQASEMIMGVMQDVGTSSPFYNVFDGIRQEYL